MSYSFTRQVTGETILADDINELQVGIETIGNTDLPDHEAATTSVHGIADTSVLETTTGSQAKVDTHAADTTSVHGITDTSALETTTGAQSKVDTAVSAHDAEADGVHGIPVVAEGAIVRRTAGGWEAVEGDDGSMLVRSSGVWTPLAPGDEGDTLVMVSGVPEWEGYNTLVTNGLVAHWDFSDNSGQVLTDSVGSFDGQLGSTSGADTNDPTWGTSRLTFDGTDDYVTFTPTGLPTGNSDLTMVIVGAISGTFTNRTFMSYGTPATRRFPQIIVPNNTVVRFGAYAEDLDVPWLASTTFAGTWRYRASDLTLDGIINNFAVMRSKTIGGTPNWGSDYGYFGATRNSSTIVNYHTGPLYYGLIYNRRLTDAEVSRNFRYLQKQLSLRGVTI